MTFRAKPVVKRDRRPSWESASRRNLYLNLGFGAVVVLAVLILVAAAAASWYGDHYGEVAKVDGVTITKDQYRDRLKIEAFRLDQADAQFRDAFNAGRLTEAQLNQQSQSIAQQRQNISQVALERLIDAQLQSKLASENGVTVDQAAVDARLAEEATQKEQRHVWVIDVKPDISAGTDQPTDAQKAAAKKRADDALAELKAGKKFEDVARTASDDPTKAQGGDLGWVTQDSGLDKAFVDAVFAAQPNQPTDVIEGQDGTYRIGRVTDVAPQTVDSLWTTKITDAGIPLDSYRAAVRADVIRDRLEKKVVADVVDTATPQRRVQEIYIAQATQGTGDEVRVRHILYSPKNDPQGAGALPENDPAWEAAHKEAQAAYDALKPLVGKTDELEKAFEAKAKSDSDEEGAKASGGELPYYTRDRLDKAFGEAIFAPDLKKGDLIGPVKTQFGWHVILFEDRRVDPEQRMNGVKLDADAGKDFGQLAKDNSEGPEAATGGNIGWVARDQFQQQLEDAIFKTAVGKVSDIVTIDGDGYYLYKVLEEQTRKPDGDQKTTLENSAFRNWYAEKKAAAQIERSTSASGTPTQ